MIVDGPKQAIAAYVMARTGCEFSGGYSALASVRDGKIEGAAIFDIWRMGDIEVSVVGSRFPRSFVRACGRYVFDGLKCRRATFHVRAKDGAALRAALRLGAKVEGVKRAFYPDDDAILLGVTREDFKYGVI